LLHQVGVFHLLYDARNYETENELIVDSHYNSYRTTWNIHVSN